MLERARYWQLFIETLHTIPGDERRSVMERLESRCMEQMYRLAEVIREKVSTLAARPPVVTVPKVASSIRDSKEVGEYFAKQNVKILITCIMFGTTRT